MSNSPIRKIFDYVAASPFRIASEGANELRRELDESDVVLEYVVHDTKSKKKKVLAEYDTEEKVVRLGEGFLEALWAAAHLYLVALRGYQEAQAAKNAIFNLGADPRVRAAYMLYLDRLESLGSSRPTAWPKDSIRPIRYPYEHSDVYASNELFLVAAGWIIHHELAHARLKHEEDAPDSMQQEHAADSEATQKVCAAPGSPEELTKRSLGIAAAVLLLIARDIRGKRRFFTTHPPSYERLLNVLTLAGLNENHITYAVAFVILDIHLTDAKLATRLDRNQKTFRDLCFEACMVLRELAVVRT